jgi:hypothetical protein
MICEGSNDMDYHCPLVLHRLQAALRKLPPSVLAYRQLPTPLSEEDTAAARTSLAASAVDVEPIGFISRRLDLLCSYHSERFTLYHVFG